MSRVLLCQRDELAPGELKKVAHREGDAICVYNLGGTFYATTDMCTHATASLAEGDLEDDLITCPVHWGVPCAQRQGGDVSLRAPLAHLQGHRHRPRGVRRHRPGG